MAVIIGESTLINQTNGKGRRGFAGARNQGSSPIKLPKKRTKKERRNSLKFFLKICQTAILLIEPQFFHLNQMIIINGTMIKNIYENLIFMLSSSL